jgi:pimeloyl-ACP methyl ester carboxylesterase
VIAAFTATHRGGAGEPLLCGHGFTDTWRTWELVLPRLECVHDVLAPTLPGHAGGPRLPDDAGAAELADALERALDDAGIATAHVVGNSLGGYLALELAMRGRARSVVALAPAGGWAAGDAAADATLEHFTAMQEALRGVAPYADAAVATPEGRRRATSWIVEDSSLIPAELLAHMVVGAAGCEAAGRLVQSARRDGWSLAPERITCPVRVVWGTADRLLEWPRAAARYRDDWLPTADWTLLDGAGHCPQLERPVEVAQLILGVSAR